MMDLKERYLKNPCKTLSIPYWKHLMIGKHPGIDIYHFEDQVDLSIYKSVDKFFRMIHHLDDTYEKSSKVLEINIEKDIEVIVKHINQCYHHENIKVSAKDIERWKSTPVFYPKAWIKIEENQKIIASGIADFDEDLKEGIIEWIQVDPKYQGLGYGREILKSLIAILQEKADFITVSGHLDNEKNPKVLYEKLGFQGNDVWLICYK